MKDRNRRALVRSGLFGGAVLLLLGLFLVWAALTGMASDGDWAYFTALLVLGGCMFAQAAFLMMEAGAGGPTQGTDGAMVTVHGIMIICLGWLALNVDRIHVIQVTNGEVHFTGVPEEVAAGLALLLLLSILDSVTRLRRRTGRATLNTTPRSTGPNAGP